MTVDRFRIGQRVRVRYCRSWGEAVITRVGQRTAQVEYPADAPSRDRSLVVGFSDLEVLS